jgi:hypothetical protein
LDTYTLLPDQHPLGSLPFSLSRILLFQHLFLFQNGHPRGELFCFLSA